MWRPVVAILVEWLLTRCSLSFRLNPCCATLSAASVMLLFPVSPHHFLSEEIDKILKECEKERIFPQLFLLKDLASVWRGLFKVSD